MTKTKQQRFRERMTKLGLKRLELWAHPSIHARVKAYAVKQERARKVEQ